MSEVLHKLRHMDSQHRSESALQHIASVCMSQDAHLEEDETLAAIVAEFIFYEGRQVLNRCCRFKPATDITIHVVAQIEIMLHATCIVISPASSNLQMFLFHFVSTL